jgi:hypothetical protein
MMHSISCFHDVNQHNISITNSLLLDLVLTNINDLSLYITLSYCRTR